MHTELWSLERLKPYDKNPRVNDGAVEAVARSIDAFGFRQAIVADADGVIVCGHTRYKAALKLGLKKVPVHVAKDLSAAQIKAYRLTDNKTAELATWDLELLPIELADLQGMDVDLELLGFSSDELAKLLDPGAKEGLTDPDAVPEPPDEPTTQPGDLWVLGDHRFLCGDSTRQEDLARVMGDVRAEMLFTDPPWNVAIGSDKNPRHRQRAGMRNDDLSEHGFRAFLSAFISAAGPYLDGDLFCVLGASMWPLLDCVLRDAGFHWSATIIWVKDAFVLGRSHFHRRYEPIWYGWRKASSFTGRRDLDDVWEVARPKRSPEHPTMKPVQLIERAIRASSGHDGVVLDPFLGSGATLIAAERLGRRCYGLEIEPRYCDVIVQRWEQFTGKKAERHAAT